MCDLTQMCVNFLISSAEVWITLDQEDPWRRKWQTTPVFLPGELHEQSSLADYSPWGCKRVGHDLVTKQQQILIINEKSTPKYLKGKAAQYRI